MSIHTQDATAQLAQRYGAAWNAHELDAILTMHHPDSEFELHLEDFPRASGLKAVQAQFVVFFATWPDMHFATRRLHVRSDLFVHEFVLTATLTQPFPIGGRLVEPAGQRIEVDGTDVIPCMDGMVLAKETYVDGVALARQLDLAENTP